MLHIILLLGDITVYGLDERETSGPSALLPLDASYSGYIETEVSMKYKLSWSDTHFQNFES